MASGMNRLLNRLRRKGNTGQLMKTAGPTGPNWDSGGAANRSAGSKGWDGGYKGPGGKGLAYRGGATGSGGNSGRAMRGGRKATY